MLWYIVFIFLNAETGTVSIVYNHKVRLIIVSIVSLTSCPFSYNEIVNLKELNTRKFFIELEY